ncbi:Ppx/GppA phosphatase family protein [Limisalsivibrio acetivorans]|uniref:Ppx/GppA phosphatase family protein n=1 Tax=Limisalsivibrio acetivorans TaxID=1304888 RepID=UPI0003B46EDC|nr:Ppx/GppA phosphatase family protein [Limisalsivibrio acetivorans]
MLQLDLTSVAVVDIGSNTVRLQVSELKDKSYKVVEEYKESVRLGDEVFNYGRITEPALERLLASLREVRSIVEHWKVDTIRAVATASFRGADNFEEVIDKIRETCGFNVEVISGEDEARFTCIAATANFQLTKYNALVLDIGGGSAEYSFVRKGVLERAVSLELGCNRLTRQYLKGDPPKSSEVQELKDLYREEIKKLNIDDKIDIIICTGGSMGNLATINYIEKKARLDRAVKYVERKYLKRFISDFRNMSVKERIEVEGMEEKRADIILAAAMQVDIVLEHAEREGFYTLSGGLRTGLTIDTVNSMGIELPFQQNLDDIRHSRLIEIGNKFLFEERHARQVCRLCQKLFDSVAEEEKLTSDDWQLLEAAALLHDIGNYISYSKHHRHSQYLIMNSDLIGYDHDEIVLIGNIARYHRKKGPQEKHRYYRGLSSSQKKKVAVLAGILRIADALDRSHRSHVKELEIKSSKKEMNIKVVSGADVSMELRKVDIKKDILEETINKEIVFK